MRAVKQNRRTDQDSLLSRLGRKVEFFEIGLRDRLKEKSGVKQGLVLPQSRKERIEAGDAVDLLRTENQNVHILPELLRDAGPDVRPQFLRVGAATAKEHVPALQITPHVIDPQRFNTFLQVGHPNFLPAGDVDAAQERDEDGHCYVAVAAICWHQLASGVAPARRTEPGLMMLCGSLLWAPPSASPV